MLDNQIVVFSRFIMAFYDLLARNRKEVKNSLTFFRVVFFYRELRWIQNCISQNAYHQAIRELRFVLDSIIQAYYIDERHYNLEMPCKLEIVKEIEEWGGFGGRLIDRTALRHKRELKNLYGELSAYVHSSHKELVQSRPKRAKEIASLKFEKDIEMANLCVNFANRTIDAVFFVTLSLFPQIFGPHTRAVKIKASFPGSLKELGCRLTLGKLEAILPSSG